MMTSLHANKKQKGFTIIEVMIAMAIFTVIVTIGIGSVLNAISQHQTTQNTRTIMDNLNFMMEDMTRNIRLGSNIRCVTDPSEVESFTSDTDPVTPQSCPNTLVGSSSNKIIFNDLNGRHLTYVISAPTLLDPISKVYKQKGDGAGTAQMINPAEVEIDFAKSGFTVRGAEIGPDLSQPTVVIRLAGVVKYKDYNSTFDIQTTVALRALDS